MASIVYCKVYGIDGVHFVKLEREKFTFKWLSENFVKSKQKVEKLLAYDDFSGDRVLLSNEDEFSLMMDMMDDVGANMVKLYVTKIKKKTAPEGKCARNRELLRGGSFGIFDPKSLRGFDKVGKTSNSGKAVFKPLLGAYIGYMKMEHNTSLNVADINAKCDKGSVKVICSGKIGHPDFNFLFDKQTFEWLKDDPQKCAWIDREKFLAYVFHFQTEKDAVEFYNEISEMIGESVQEKSDH